MSQPYDATDDSAPTDDQGVFTQLEGSDSLDAASLADPLDTGYSPPDREPSVRVPTESEQEQGESLAERLSEEEPEVWQTEGQDQDEERYEVGAGRAGRLYDSETDGLTDTEKDLVAGDAGIDGGAASAEEAAVHVIDDDADGNGN